MKKVGGFIATAFAVKEVVNFTKAAVNAASETQAAWTGLNSIVNGTGNSFKVAQDFITDYTKDGLVSVNEAVTAYKNLLSRGYDTSQIEGTMNALKDSASFGRQASYGLGEAVVTATEGLKNENSILVDNAGVTKNVAKMWDEYAASIGKTSNNLTQAEKIQAEYNGIMKETRFQTGDAIAYANTFSGQVQRLKASFTSLKVAVGKVVVPIAQLFIPVINGAVNALTNLFNGISKILSAFGFKFQEVVGKNTNSVATFTKGVSDSGDAAVKAAKKANKAFSNVDEINVLSKSKESKDSGGSSGGASSNVSVVPTVATDDAVSSAIDGTISKIMKYIEPLKNIKFDNLINAFGNLWNSLKLFGKTIGSGLEWLYFNILVPLAKWTIEDVLPSFLNILSGALDVVNQAISDIQPIFQWFWDYILKPIAEWTGGVIVDVLNGIGNALKWISDNEVAMTILESLGITIGVIAGAIAVYNGAMAICNVATGVFSGIMTVLTSPITLVILAITALITVITLLVKHWDDVKEVASKCWEWIKNVWKNVAEWFNITIIQPVSNFFSNMWNGLINGAKNTWNGIKNVFSTVASFFKNTFSTAWNAVKNIFSVGGKIFDGIKDGIVNAFKTIVNGIIGGINKVVSIPFNGINKALIKVRDISFLGIEPFKNVIKTIDVPQIPKLAQGGYVDRNNPQLAIVGDNTREGEIITPESKIYDQVDKAIKNNNARNQELHIILEVRYEDGKTIIKKINQEQIDAGEILLLT